MSISIYIYLYTVPQLWWYLYLCLYIYIYIPCYIPTYWWLISPCLWPSSPGFAPVVLRGEHAQSHRGRQRTLVWGPADHHAAAQFGALDDLMGLYQAYPGCTSTWSVGRCWDNWKDKLGYQVSYDMLPGWTWSVGRCWDSRITVE